MEKEEVNKSTTTDQLANIEARMVDIKHDFQKAIRTKRSLFLISLSIFVFIGLNYAKVVDFSLWFIAPSWVFALLFLIASVGTETGKIKTELEKLESVKRLYFGFLDEKTDEPYFNKLVKINVENLSEYYSLVKQHTNQSFKISALVVTSGFLLLAGGLTAGFLNPEYREISYVAAGSGIVVNFIGGAVFLLYTKTVLQLKQYHDSLLDVQNILLAFKLVEGTPDATERAKMTQKMIEFLSSRQPKQVKKDQG